MDAASTSGIDDIRDLLEKAAYAPANARFKVYMIDEVHMLSRNAFAALLKTLEEPPEHVKFILATTDPQKIPVTILSRCLQFNLKQMPVPLIVEHLEKVLAAEKVDYETNALRVLAKAAQGSMRDALSLTDQAIAYAAGKVSEEAVRGMLGTLDDAYLIRILDALIAKDGATLLAISNEMGERSMSFSLALADLSSLIQKIAAAQIVPESVLEDWPEASEIHRLSSAITKEEAQLFYQISITSRPDLSLAPDEQTGFAMTLLRMLAFRPGNETPSRAGGNTSNSAPPVASGASAPRAPSPANHTAAPVRTAAPAPSVSKPAATTPVASATPAPTASASAAERPDWHALMRQLPVKGLVQQLAFQTELQDWDDKPAGVRATIVTPMLQLASEASVGRLADALTAHFGKPVKVVIEKGELEGKTVAKVDAQIHQEKRLNAEQLIAQDPFILQLEKEFGAKVVGGSVKPH
jgi:DNA polymerase-3 subunit gamma/tau